jgi:hypothetical protein
MHMPVRQGVEARVIWGVLSQARGVGTRHDESRACDAVEVLSIGRLAARAAAVRDADWGHPLTLQSTKAVVPVGKRGGFRCWRRTGRAEVARRIAVALEVPEVPEGWLRR